MLPLPQPRPKQCRSIAHCSANAANNDMQCTQNLLMCLCITRTAGAGVLSTAGEGSRLLQAIYSISVDLCSQPGSSRCWLAPTVWRCEDSCHSTFIPPAVQDKRNCDNDHLLSLFAGSTADSVVQHGLFLAAGARETIRFLPPLNVKKEELQEALHILDKALGEVF